MLSLKCPNCGATIQFEKERPATFCQFCGSHLNSMNGYVNKAVNFEFSKQEHNMNMQTMDKEIKKERLKTVAETTMNVAQILRYIGIIIVAGIVLYYFISIFSILSR